MRGADICLLCPLISWSVVLQQQRAHLLAKHPRLPPRGSSSLKCLLSEDLRLLAKPNTTTEGLKAPPFNGILVNVKTPPKHSKISSGRGKEKRVDVQSFAKNA